MTVPSAEGGPEVAFNPVVCAEHTMATLPFESVDVAIGMQGRVFEERFFGADAGQRLAAVRAMVCERLADPAQLTPECREEMAVEGAQAQYEIGVQFMGRAKELGMPLQILEQDEARANYQGVTSAVLSHAVNRHMPASMFHAGWQVFANTMPTRTHLLYPVATVDPRFVRFQVLNLDDLYSRDPEFVRGQLEQYYALRLRDRAIEYMDLGVRFHQVSLENAFTPLVREFAAIDDPEERARETKQVADFLGSYARTGHGPHAQARELVHGREREYQEEVVARFGEALAHRASCPASSDLERAEGARYAEAFTVLQGAIGPKRSWRGDISDEIRILSDPEQYMPRIAYKEQAKRLMSTSGVEGALQALGAEAPEAYKEIIKLRAVLGDEDFQLFLTDVALDGILGRGGNPPITRSSGSLTTVIPATLNAFSRKYDQTEQDAKAAQLRARRASYSPQGLFGLGLSLVAIKHAETLAAAIAGAVEPDNLPAGARAMEGHTRCHRVKQDWIEIVSLRSGRAVDDTKARKLSLKFRNDNNITDENLAALDQILVPVRDSRIASFNQYAAYRLILHALWMSRNGRLDMCSPRVQSVVMGMISDAEHIQTTSRTAWEKLLPAQVPLQPDTV